MSDDPKTMSYALFCPQRNMFFNYCKSSWTPSVIELSNDNFPYYAKFKDFCIEYAIRKYFGTFGRDAFPIELREYDRWDSVDHVGSTTFHPKDFPRYTNLYDLHKLSKDFSSDHLFLTLPLRQDWQEFNFMMKNERSFETGKKVYDSVFKQSNCKVYHDWMAIKTEQQIIFARLKYDILKIIDLNDIKRLADG